MAKTKPKPAMNKRELWCKAGRFITAVTLACFFLPFFGVSCRGADVITISGADMAGGCRPGGVLADAEQQARNSARRAGKDMDAAGSLELGKVPREPLAIAALALALVVFGLSWLRAKGAMTAAFALSITCIGALIALKIQVGGELDVQLDAYRKGHEASSVGNDMMKETQIDAGSRWGLWATIATLVGVAALTGLALTERDTA